MPIASELGVLFSAEDSDLARRNLGLVTGYAKVWVCNPSGTGRGHYEMTHRIVLERMIGRRLVHGEQCDHINRNRLDNRRQNLRLCDGSLNTHNRSPSSNTGIRGVYWDKTQGRYVWSVWRLGKRLRGYADTPEQAEDKLKQAIQKLGYESSSLQ